MPIEKLSSHAICHRRVGFVPEDRRIFPGLTVEENLTLGSMQVRGRSRAEARRKLDETYDQFPRLRERRQQFGTTLSGGEQQMLAMARALMGDPKLLLIDEPTEGLAPKIVDELFALIGRLSAAGVPILLVEQNVRRAIGLTQRFYVFERGAVVLAGDSTSASDRDADGADHGVGRRFLCVLVRRQNSPHPSRDAPIYRRRATRPEAARTPDRLLHSSTRRAARRYRPTALRSRAPG